MENASKALIIAGAVLVAIMIVSLSVLIFRNFSETAKNAANMDEQEIAEFNSKILPYTGESISGSQVNALVQLVLSIDTSCVSKNDSTQAVTLSYKDRTTNNELLGVSITEDASEGLKLNRTGSIRRVPTGSSEYYNVEYDFNRYGLINNITITHN